MPHYRSHMLLASASIGVIAAFSPASATALPDFLSFAAAGDFTGWTRVSSSTVVATNSTYSKTLGDGVHGPYTTYNLAPAAGQYMAVITPGSSGVSSTFLNHADAVFGLTTNTFSSIFSGLSGSPTNYGALTETTTLNAGTTYTFYWSYAAQDYKAFNDGVFFTLAGNGVNAVSVLASNGGEPSDPNGGGPQIGTNVVGTFGATQWAAYSFTVPTTGNYLLGFGAYNWAANGYANDTGIDPIFFVGASAGTVVVPGASTPIDTNAAYYNLTNIGTSVDPDFRGGTLRIDTPAATAANFTVGTYSGNAIDAYGHVGLFSGSFGGNGGLTIKDTAGSGAVVFTGANVYAGGTTIASGATLQLGNGGTTGSIIGTIENNGTLVYKRSDTIGYTSVISGTGKLNVASGTLILTAANTYTGLTSIAAGAALQLGNGETTGSIVSDVANEGQLIFNRSDTVTFNGTVTGGGTLVQSGTGKVIVTTSYTGKTIVNSGTLQIGNGATSGTVTGNITNNATVVYGQAAATSYTGIISGAGGVSVAGGGVVILNGANTYTGPTTVTAGSLVIGDISHPSAAVTSGVTVSSGGLVGGYGTIGGNLVASGGIVSPGNSIGVLTVSGNYTQSAASTLKIELTPSASDKLAVGGMAQLGGPLELSLASGDYGTKSFAFLTANSVTGKFSTVSYSGARPDMVYGVVYGAKEVDLAMTPKSSGQIYGDLVTQGIDTAAMLDRATLDHLGVAAARGWSVWSRVIAGASQTDGIDGLSDFNSQLWGVASGLDYQFAGGAKLAGVFAYTRNQLGVTAPHDKASGEGYFFSLAAHLVCTKMTLDFTGFVQHNVAEVARDGGTATANTGNVVSGGSAEAAYPIGDFAPFARLTVTSLHANGFAEAGTLALSVDTASRTSVRGTWGVKISHDYTTSTGAVLSPRFVIGMQDEFGQQNREFAMGFAGTSFLSPGVTPDDFSGIVDASLTAKVMGSLEFSAGASGRWSSNQREAILNIGLRYAF